MNQPTERRVAERRKDATIPGTNLKWCSVSADQRTATGDRRKAPAPAESEAEVRGKLKELFAGEPFYEMSTDEVIDQILTLIRPHKPSPEDLERVEKIRKFLYQPHGPSNISLEWQTEFKWLLAAWGLKGGGEVK